MDLRPAIISLTLLLFGAPANAGTVAIVQPSNRTADLTETVSRLQGELISVGLDVRLIAPPAGRSPDRTDSRAWMEAIAAAGGVDAVIDIVGDETPIWVDVWVIEKSPHRLERWRVESEPNTENASERLAIRAIEVLRSSILESDMKGKVRPRAPAPKPPSNDQPKVESHASPERPERVGLSLGAVALASLDGLGPAILPVIHLDAKLHAWFGLHAELAALGTSSRVSTEAGSARVTQSYGTVGGSYRFAGDGVLSPFVSLCAGALHSSIKGEPQAANLGHNATQLSFLLDAGAGAALRLPGRFFVSLSGHAQWAEPYVAIHIVDSTVATSGLPNLVLGLAVGAWL